MSLALYAHPFSSYSQKVLLALWENQTPFQFRDLEESAHQQALAQLWPLRRFPVLVDGDQVVVEATTIIEYLHVRHPGPVPLLPADPLAAVRVRMLDRFFDNYISTPQQKLVYDRMREPQDRDRRGVAEARQQLDTAYAWLEGQLADGRPWAAGDAFSLADCGAAPFLFYADWTHPIPQACEAVRRYRQRLLARPSMARAVEQARPYRSYFPGGAPDRD
jgi:glutathione S-transferase